MNEKFQLIEQAAEKLNALTAREEGMDSRDIKITWRESSIRDAKDSVRVREEDIASRELKVAERESKVQTTVESTGPGGRCSDSRALDH
jgi:uncharacterized protein (DUF3084 family)